MRRRTPLILSLLVLIAIGAAACSGGGPSGPTSDIVATIPWQGSENLSYALKDGRGDTVGSGRLTIEVSGGQTVLTQLYESEAGSDRIEVRVDSRTLKPVSATRQIRSRYANEMIEVTYTPEGALIRKGGRQSGLSVPEHSYDNDSSLFLWRTLPFEASYEARYVTIITNRRSRQLVEIEVTGRETVRVAAGEFPAWRLAIRTSNAKQTAWYASELPARPLLRYDNDRGTIFELQGLP